MTIERKSSHKKPWPTKDAMAQIYEQQLWGAGASSFYSGEGSHLDYIVKPYIRALRAFFSAFESPLSVADLGCGDFNIGSKLTQYTSQYIGVDIVPSLIIYNKKLYADEITNFQCLDLAKDDLPLADCAIVRQVLQHLSNEEIHDILNKLVQYRYLIITEHLPKGNFRPNQNIISGQGTRLKKGSGVAVLAPPFNLKIKSKKELVAVALNNGKGIIKTVLYTLF